MNAAPVDKQRLMHMSDDSMVRFEDFPLKPEILKALKEMGFEEPTEIQEKSLSLVLDGEDVIGASKTGSGKTAAFGVPLLNYVEDGYGLQVLILAPTRELAVQIAGEMEKFSKYLDVNVATIYGGVAYEPQLEAMQTAHILVATPGRLLDHLQQGNFDLGGIFSFVLDEADKMVEMGFIEDIEEIMGYGPGDEQMLLFGATIAGEIERIKNEYMRSPKVVEAERYVEEEVLKQYYYNLQPYEKFSMLVHLLNQESFDRAIVFCSSRATVDDVSDNLTRQGFKNVKIHGKLAQASRLKMLDRFNKGEVPILVASAVAARGLDIKQVTHVFNYDVSKDPQEYIHRIGRTARAGEEGKAYTLLTQRDHDSFNNVIRNYDVKLEELPLPRFKRVPFKKSEGGFRSDSRGRDDPRDRGPRRGSGRPPRR